MTPPALRRSTRPRRSVVRGDNAIRDIHDIDDILDRLDRRDRGLSTDTHSGSPTAKNSRRKPGAVAPDSCSGDDSSSDNSDSDSDVYKPSQSRHQCEYRGIKNPSRICCLIVLLQALRGLCKGEVKSEQQPDKSEQRYQRCRRDFLDYWENEDMNRLLASMEKEIGYSRREIDDPAALLPSLGLGLPWLLSPTASRLHDCPVRLPLSSLSTTDLLKLLTRSPADPS